MGRECAITGKKTTVGRRIVRKGLSKKKRWNWIACYKCE